jgi:hypothetical protein
MLESMSWNESQGYFEALRPRNKGTTSSTPTSNLRLASTYCSNLLTGIGAPLAKLQADLKEFIALLNSHGVEYILVGGHAVAYHGHPRFTGDIDFLIRATEVNAERVLAVLEDFGFGSVGIDESDLLKSGQVIQLGQPPNRIDLLTSISAVDFDSAWQSRIQTAIDDQPVNILGWEALLRNKRASARQKDLADVEKLLAIAKRKNAG